MSQEVNEKSLLIYVHGDQLGDALQKLPAIATLRDAFPGYFITWMAGGGASIFNTALAPLIEKYVDRVIDNANVGTSWLELFHAPLNRQFFQLIIDTQNVIRATILLKRIPHKTFISPAASFLFSDLEPASRKIFYESNIQQRFLTMISMLSGKKVNPVYQLDIPVSYREQASKLLPSGPVYIGLAPGAGDRRRCWPLENYIEFANYQAQTGRTPVFFIGPDEEDMIPAIKTVLKNAVFPEQENNSVDIRGPLLSLALAERIALGVANNSGPGHILAAAGQPVISLYGPGNVSKFTGTSVNQLIINARDYGGIDMKLIPLADVIDAADNLLKSTA